MRSIKTILLSLALLLLCGVGVMAEGVTMPTQYIDAQGQVKEVTFNGIIGNQPTEEEKQKAAEQTVPPTGTTLKPSEDGSTSWYWAGGNIQGQAVSVNGPLTFENGTNQNNPSGIVNIVVGPNGKGGEANAMSVAGGLNIPPNVTVNIYQAANGLGDDISVPAGNCFLWFNGKDQDTVKDSNSQPGITVQAGGKLNVNSGVITGQGSPSKEESTAANGILIQGQVTVSEYGTLEGVSPKDSGIAGISLSGTLPTCSLTSSGTVASFTVSGSAVGFGSTIEGLSNLTVNNGAVYSSIPYNGTEGGATNAKLYNGLWFMSNSSNGYLTGTAFGTSTFNNARAIVVSFADTESLTIPSNASLTISNGTINFGSEDGSSTVNKAKLTVEGELTISSKATINLYSNSTLSNTGTINVEES